MTLVPAIEEIAMQRFASRDLMVTTLPQQGEWAADGGCDDCTNCTDNTAKPRPKPARDADLFALQQQLRAAVSIDQW